MLENSRMTQSNSEIGWLSVIYQHRASLEAVRLL